MKKRKILKEPFWKLAIRFGLIFIVVVVIIQLIWEFFSSGNLNSVSESLKNGQWITYVISKVIVGGVYGVVMAYFTKRNAKK
ncbi:MAG TPA: hypothetical protein EYG92_01560 [Lutibacter sp.]|nr:hypothetical protein [Lutibacter sp.]